MVYDDLVRQGKLGYVACPTTRPGRLPRRCGSPMTATWPPRRSAPRLSTTSSTTPPKTSSPQPPSSSDCPSCRLARCMAGCWLSGDRRFGGSGFTDTELEIGRAVKRLSQEWGLEPYQVSLAWLLSRPAVASAIVEEPVTFVVPTEIGSQRVHLTAGVRHLACRLLDARLRARRDTDPTVLGQQRLGSSPAEPSAGGGDQGALAPQAQLHDPMLDPLPRQMPPLTTARDCALLRLGPNTVGYGQTAYHGVLAADRHSEQKLASTEATFRFDATGSAVNRTPAASRKTICCTTTRRLPRVRPGWPPRRTAPVDGLGDAGITEDRRVREAKKAVTAAEKTLRDPRRLERLAPARPGRGCVARARVESTPVAASTFCQIPGLADRSGSQRGHLAESGGKARRCPVRRRVRVLPDHSGVRYAPGGFDRPPALPRSSIG